jgi:hypothetical protein
MIRLCLDMRVRAVYVCSKLLPPASRQIGVASSEQGAVLRLVRSRVGVLLSGCFGSVLRLSLALERAEALLSARDVEVGGRCDAMHCPLRAAAVNEALGGTLSYSFVACGSSKKPCTIERR